MLHMQDMQIAVLSVVQKWRNLARVLLLCCHLYRDNIPLPLPSQQGVILSCYRGECTRCDHQWHGAFRPLAVWLFRKIREWLRGLFARH